jgi:hypothetical protein
VQTMHARLSRTRMNPLASGAAPLLLRAGSGAASASACAGTTKLVLHAQQALGQAQALEFCRASHGAGAYLPAQAGPVMDAAQALVQAAGVRAHAPAAVILGARPPMIGGRASPLSVVDA